MKRIFALFFLLIMVMVYTSSFNTDKEENDIYRVENNDEYEWNSIGIGV